MGFIQACTGIRLVVLAFTYASCGEIELDLQNSTIKPKEDFDIGTEYEVYNRLSEPNKSLKALSTVNPEDFPIDSIVHSVKVRGDRFSHQLNPKMVAEATTAMKPIFDGMFLLPSEWEFSRYTLGEFRKVFEAISAMAAIRLIARRTAITLGCSDRGHTDGVYVMTFDELLRRVVSILAYQSRRCRASLMICALEIEVFQILILHCNL